MNIEKVSIDELNFAKYNPRKDLCATDAEYVKLKNSIEHFGYVDPVIVNKPGMVVVGGHQRLKVLRDLGYKEIEVVYVNLNDKDEKALNIALNKISGDWDAEKLEDLLRELSLDSDYDVSLTGFDDEELDTLFSGAVADLDNTEKDMKSKMKQAINIDDEIESQLLDMEDTDSEEENTRNVQLGDVWQLGRHKLFCGDSSDKEQILKFIGDTQFDCIMTDPPYDCNINGSGHLISLNNSMKKYYKQRGYVMPEKLDKEFTDGALSLMNWDCNKIAWIKDLGIKNMFIFTSKDGIKKYLNMFDDFKYDILFWCKKDPTPFKSGTFFPDLEYMLYFYKQGKIYNNFDKPSAFKKYFLSSKLQGIKDNNNEKIHPTMKPLELISDKLQIASNDGGNVLDLFGGSGTTLIACEETGRTCYMVEMSPKYFNVIIDRFEKVTGQRAYKIEGDNIERDEQTSTDV
jgi:DNA modification methylase